MNKTDRNVAILRERERERERESSNLKNGKIVGTRRALSENNKLKQNSAITLIALVITIIVLLILAGITLTLVLGENGLFNKAKDAKGQYQAAQEVENNKLSDLENEMNSALVATRTEPATSSNEYHAGDTVSYNGLILPGHIRGNGTEMEVTVFLSKNIGSDIKSISVTYGSTISKIFCNGNNNYNAVSSVTASIQNENAVGLFLNLSSTLPANHAASWDVAPVTLSFSAEE